MSKGTAQSRPTTESKRRPVRRWFVASVVALIAVIVLGIFSLEIRYRKRMRHVAAIENMGGIITGKSNAPVWLQRLSPGEMEHFGPWPDPMGPDWLREHLPADALLKYFDHIERVELGLYGGQHILSNLSGVHDDPLFIFEITEFDESVLAHLKAMSDLMELNLVRTGVRDSSLIHLHGLTNLRWLSLDDNPVSDSGLKHLSKLTRLETLLLADTEISDSGLIHLSHLIELRRLDLSGTKVSDVGLASLARLKKLEVLDLSGSKVNDSGLAELRHLKSLRWLDLGNTSVTDAGIAQLKVLDNLQYLNLSGTGAGLPGIKHLRRLKKLKVLWIRSKLTAQQLDKLRRWFPKVDVKQFTGLSLGMGWYHDLLNSLDEPGFDGGFYDMIAPPHESASEGGDFDLQDFFDPPGSGGGFF